MLQNRKGRPPRAAKLKAAESIKTLNAKAAVIAKRAERLLLAAEYELLRKPPGRAIAASELLHRERLLNRG